jgi:hypothetical protein
VDMYSYYAHRLEYTPCDNCEGEEECKECEFNNTKEAK